MAVALRLDFTNFRLDDYDVCKALNFPADWPDGLIVHGSTEVDVASRLQGAMGQAMGDRAEAPQITEMDLHTLYAKGYD
jgi:hypothetical protein